MNDVNNSEMLLIHILFFKFFFFSQYNLFLYYVGTRSALGV